MISRRHVLGGTTIGSLLASFGPGAEPAAAAVIQKDDAAAIEDVARTLKDLNTELRRQNSFWELDAIRAPIQQFLRNTGKFPDFLEVGTDIWQQIYEWHVRHMQPFTIGRTTEGRYTIVLLATLCIMRTELPANYVGTPYDNR